MKSEYEKTGVTRIQLKPKYQARATALCSLFGLETVTDLVGFLITHADVIACSLGKDTHTIP